MESFALATLLFCVYFVAACCFLYEPNKVLSSEQFSLLLREAGEETTPSAPPTPSAPSAPLTPPAPPLLEGIDLDTMQLRPARKIAGKLGIAQKVNGKDAPLAWLRAQIKNRLSEKPIETAPIILAVMTVA